MSSFFSKKNKPTSMPVTWQTVKSNSKTRKKRAFNKNALKVLKFVGRFLMSAGVTFLFAYIFCNDNAELYGLKFDLFSGFNPGSLFFFCVIFAASLTYVSQFILLIVAGIAFFLYHYGPDFPPVWDLLSIFFPLSLPSICAYAIYLTGMIIERLASRKNISPLHLASVFSPGMVALSVILLPLGQVAVGICIFCLTVKALFVLYTTGEFQIDTDHVIKVGIPSITIFCSGYSLNKIGTKLMEYLEN